MERKLVAVPDIDDLADAFFRAPSLAPVERYRSDWMDDDGDSLDADTRASRQRSARAMQATLAILGVSSVVVGAMLLYSKVLMPTPAALGEGGPIAAPMFTAVEPSMVPAPAAPAVIAAAIPAAAASTPTAPALDVQAAALTATPRAPQLRRQAASIESAAPAARAARRPARRAGASPDDARVRSAFANLNAGRLAAAIADARGAVSTHPERADAWLVLGSAYDRLADHSSAQLAYRACAARASGPFVRDCQRLAR